MWQSSGHPLGDHWPLAVDTKLARCLDSLDCSLTQEEGRQSEVSPCAYCVVPRDLLDAEAVRGERLAVEGEDEVVFHVELVRPGFLPRAELRQEDDHVGLRGAGGLVRQGEHLHQNVL